MKQLPILLCALMIYSFGCRAQSSPYRLVFPALGNEGAINMSAFSGKKVIVAEFDAAAPDNRQLLSLDTLYMGNTDRLVVILVPVSDFSGVLPGDSLKNILRGVLGLHCPIAAVSKARKTDGAAQHPLMLWLTSKLENGHFDDDIEKAGEIFFLGENGKLFARLRDGMPLGMGLVNKLLARQVSAN